MNTDKASNKRLNSHKKNTNIMISQIEGLIKTLSRVNKKYSKISNICEIYRDKIYDIYNNLYKKDIDFWGNDFELREAILFHLVLKAIESGEYLKLIAEKIILLPDITMKRRLLNELIFNSMETEMNAIKNIEEYIKNYDIEKNLNNTLVDYFENIQVIYEEPNSITKKYQKMKENIKMLGIDSIENEEKLLKIIAKKEEECLDIEQNREYLDILYENIKQMYYEREEQNPQKTRKMGDTNE